jgi:hypothetical protein
LITVEFHKSERAQGNEDWYFLLINPAKPEMLVKHSWSHSVGTASFKDGEKFYSLEEFAEQKPNQFRWLLEWLAGRLTA